jgi:hypothetical protein
VPVSEAVLGLVMMQSLDPFKNNTSTETVVRILE